MSIIVLLMILATLAVTAASCFTDLRYMKIPNWQPLAILGCFIPAWLVSPESFQPLWLHLLAMGIIFAVTYIMFSMGVMGGGDSKLAAALGVWIGIKGLAIFMFYMALVGGVLGVATIVLRRKRIFKNPVVGSWVDLAQKGKNAIPYGVAISFGAWASFFHTGLIFNQLNEVFKIIH